MLLADLRRARQDIEIQRMIDDARVFQSRTPPSCVNCVRAAAACVCRGCVRMVVGACVSYVSNALVSIFTVACAALREHFFVGCRMVACAYRGESICLLAGARV